MAVEYKAGSSRMVGIVAKAVEEYRSDLKDACIQVLEATKLGGTSAVKVKQASPEGRINNFDLAVIYSGEVFHGLDDARALAQIDHGLAGWVGVEKRGRRGRPSRTCYVKKQALLIHPEVLERHGITLKHYEEVVRIGQQLTLPLETTVRKRFTDEPAAEPAFAVEPAEEPAEGAEVEGAGDAQEAEAAGEPAAFAEPEPIGESLNEAQSAEPTEAEPAASAAPEPAPKSKKKGKGYTPAWGLTN